MPLSWVACSLCLDRFTVSAALFPQATDRLHERPYMDGRRVVIHWLYAEGQRVVPGQPYMGRGGAAVREGPVRCGRAAVRGGPVRPCVEGRRVVAERPYVEGRHVVAKWLYVEGRHVTAVWRSVRQQLERPRQESVQDQHHFAPLTFKVMTSFSRIFQCRCRCSCCCQARAAVSAMAGHAAASRGDVTRGAPEEDTATGTSPLLRRSLFS